MNELKIVCAAIREDSGRVWTVEPPGRHHDIIRKMRSMGYEGPVGGDRQGFLLSNGRFAMRKAAARIALNAEQVVGGKLIGSVLTTEDLW